MTRTNTAEDRVEAQQFRDAGQAIRSKLSPDAQEAIFDDRNGLTVDVTDGRNHVLASRPNEHFVGDAVGLACLLAYMEMALALRSLLLRSDAPRSLIIDNGGCSFRQDGVDKRVQRAYFASRVGDYAVVPWHIANTLFDAVHEALLDGTLPLGDLRSTSDRTTRKVTIRFA